MDWEWFEFTWWMWLLLGVFLAVVEILTPGTLVVIFFAIGAFLVGLLDLAGLALSLPVQGLLFVATSVAALLVFRKPLLRRMEAATPAHKVDQLPGETAIAMEDIPPRAFGKAEMHGSAWNVQNIGDTPITRSQRCRVERVEGLTLYVRA
jgi:membrane protein implicated in regulation of membrane protease activity